MGILEWSGWWYSGTKPCAVEARACKSVTMSEVRQVKGAAIGV